LLKRAIFNRKLLFEKKSPKKKKKKRCFQWMIATFGYKQKNPLKKNTG
jgi:hypothetical protein